ncbi:hypothetical protein [Streptomyces sp. PR69]|uniref:hypothetical protein n=1 Tax=Streptomyces sp. PR69 TaxID=2984950 RepID=UPI0022650FCB|nr:hypothetical protein [Streptomyces sp. PR69]
MPAIMVRFTDDGPAGRHATAGEPGRDAQRLAHNAHGVTRRRRRRSIQARPPHEPSDM